MPPSRSRAPTASDEQRQHRHARRPARSPAQGDRDASQLRAELELATRRASGLATANRALSALLRELAPTRDIDGVLSTSSALVREHEQALADACRREAAPSGALHAGARVLGARDMVEARARVLLAATEAAGATTGALFARGTDGTLAARVVVSDGAVVPPERWRQSLERFEERDAPRAARIHEQLRTGASARFVLHDAEPTADTDATGTRIIWYVPLVITSELVGHMGLAFERADDPSASASAAVEQIAPQAAVVLRLADELDRALASAATPNAHDASSARAAKLAQANRALQETVEALTADSVESADCVGLIGHILASITRHLGAESSSVWLHDHEHGTSQLAYVLEDGVVKRGGESRHPHANVALPLTRRVSMPGFGTSNAKPTLVAIDETLLTPAERAYFATLPSRFVYVLPMLHGGKHLGSFSIRLRDGTAPSAEDLEFVQALAHQATLALQLVQLAAQAKQVALAKEREQAARQRVELVDRLTFVTRRMLQRVATAQELDSFLVYVLEACTLAFSAERAEFVEEEHVSSNERDLLDHALRDDVFVIEPDGLNSSTAFTRHDEIPTEQGIVSLAVAPMYQGRTSRGLLRVRFRHARTLSLEERQLLGTFANQAVLAVELKRLSEAAQSAAVIEERNRLARDMHDTLAQGLAAILRQLETIAGAPSLDDKVRGHVQLATAIARESLVEARRSIRALRPPSLSDVSLKAALEKLVARSRAQTAAVITLELDASADEPPSDVSVEILRIASEALTNAIKHAGARQIDLRLSMHANVVHLSVRDDGRGFDVDQPFAHGVGITSMRERAARIGATFTLIAEPRLGTEIIVLWSEGGTT